MNASKEIVSKKNLARESSKSTKKARSRSEEKRQAILKAARSIFARKGFEKSMVDDIAEEAGVGKGTIYLYFQSKQKIFLDIVMDDCQQLSKATKLSMEENKSCWKKSIYSFMYDRFEYCENNPEFTRILMTEVHGMILQNRPIDPRLAMLIQEAEFMVTQIFAVAAAKGQIEQIDPYIPARTVISFTRGLIEQSLKDTPREQLLAQIDFCLELLDRRLSTR